MSQTRILCEKCGFPQTYCACGRTTDGPTDSPTPISPSAEQKAGEGPSTPKDTPTPTPRTDEAFFGSNSDMMSYSDCADFARTLERELDEATRALDKAFAQIGKFEDWIATPKEDLLANAISALKKQLAHLQQQAGADTEKGGGLQ